MQTRGLGLWWLDCRMSMYPLPDFGFFVHSTWVESSFSMALLHGGVGVQRGGDGADGVLEGQERARAAAGDGHPGRAALLHRHAATRGGSDWVMLMPAMSCQPRYASHVIEPRQVGPIVPATPYQIRHTSHVIQPCHSATSCHIRHASLDFNQLQVNYFMPTTSCRPCNAATSFSHVIKPSNSATWHPVDVAGVVGLALLLGDGGGAARGGCGRHGSQRRRRRVAGAGVHRGNRGRAVQRVPGLTPVSKRLASAIEAQM